MPWRVGWAAMAARIRLTTFRAACSRARSAARGCSRCSSVWASRPPGSSPVTRSRLPKEMKAVADAGHEIGIHGYSHENPIAMTREQETEILDKCIDLVTRLSGKRPTGYVAPWWEFSPVTNELLPRAWHQVRPLAHAQRPSALLCAGGRSLDQDRLRQEAAANGWCRCSEARRPT